MDPEVLKRIPPCGAACLDFSGAQRTHPTCDRDGDMATACRRLFRGLVDISLISYPCIAHAFVPASPPCYHSDLPL